jgi:hypothetical protein
MLPSFISDLSLIPGGAGLGASTLPFICLPSGLTAGLQVFPLAWQFFCRPAGFSAGLPVFSVPALVSISDRRGLLPGCSSFFS